MKVATQYFKRVSSLMQELKISIKMKRIPVNTERKWFGKLWFAAVISISFRACREKIACAWLFKDATSFFSSKFNFLLFTYMSGTLANQWNYFYFNKICVETSFWEHKILKIEKSMLIQWEIVSYVNVSCIIH